MSDIEIGAIGQTDEVLPYPWRKVTYTFTIKELGDVPFVPKVHAAMIELISENRRSGEQDDFTASNGVRVRVSYPDIDYSTMPEQEPSKDYVVDELDRDGQPVARRNLSFLTVPIGHTLVLTPIGDNHDEAGHD
jgi:hypothetical protein